MIILSDVFRYYSTPTGPNVLLGGVSQRFRAFERVGILSEQGAGKSTLARILTGIETPDTGSVILNGRISWPIGFSGGFHPKLTCTDNISIAARLMGENPAHILSFCRQFTEIGDEIDNVLETTSPAIKAQLGYAISMAMSFDMYIADEKISVGTTEFRERCNAMLEKRLQSAGLIFLTRTASHIEKVCNRFLVLTQGHLLECRSANHAAEVLEANKDRARELRMAAYA